MDRYIDRYMDINISLDRWISYQGIRIFSFIASCSQTLRIAFAHCAPLAATAGTPMPAVIESPRTEKDPLEAS